MTQEQIDAVNLKIHKFMGNEKLTKVQGDMLVPYIPAYNVLWDLLMKVVERIETEDKLGGIVTIVQGQCCIGARNLGDLSVYANVSNYMLMGAQGKKKSVFEAISIYLDWRNNNINK